jgi:hypothetical protein
MALSHFLVPTPTPTPQVRVVFALSEVQPVTYEVFYESPLLGLDNKLTSVVLGSCDVARYGHVEVLLRYTASRGTRSSVVG